MFQIREFLRILTCTLLGITSWVTTSFAYLHIIIYVYIDIIFMSIILLYFCHDTFPRNLLIYSFINFFFFSNIHLTKIIILTHPYYTVLHTTVVVDAYIMLYHQRKKKSPFYNWTVFGTCVSTAAVQNSTRRFRARACYMDKRTENWTRFKRDFRKIFTIHYNNFRI